MEQLLSYINTLYSLQLVSVEKVDKGFLSENHVLNDGVNKYFLKKYRFKRVQRILEVHASKEFFAHGGIPVILPIRQSDGNSFFDFEGSFYALFPFIQGRQFARNEIPTQALVSMAQMLGRMHLLGKDAKVPIDDFFRLENREKVFAKIEAILGGINKIQSLSEFDQAALKSVELKKGLLLEYYNSGKDATLPTDYLTHGDYHDQNIFFDENNQVLYVFDFEKTNYSPRTYELFRSVIYPLTDEISRGELDRVKLYIDSYAEVCPIDAEEIRNGLYLFFIKSAHGFWIEEEHYLKGNTRVDQLIYGGIKGVTYLSQHLDEFADFLVG